MKSDLYDKKLKIKSKIRQLEEEKKFLLQELAEVNNEIILWENLNPIGLVKIEVNHFTFPFHPMGGGNPHKRNYYKKEIIYLPPKEAFELLRKNEEIGGGIGKTYRQLN
jgi:hypothetical protein